jgi:hypothetical protein
MKLVDANIVLRYILDDAEGLSAEAKGIIDHNSTLRYIRKLRAAGFSICQIVRVTGVPFGVARGVER